MSFTNHFLFATLLAFSYIGRTIAGYMVHSSCNLKPGIVSARTLAQVTWSKLADRPWEVNTDPDQREWSFYANWLFGDPGTTAMQWKPDDPNIVDPTSDLDKIRGKQLSTSLIAKLIPKLDNFFNIGKQLLVEDQFPVGPPQPVPGNPGLTSWDSLIPADEVVFMCGNLDRFGPPSETDPVNAPGEFFQYDSYFNFLLPLSPQNPTTAPCDVVGASAFTYCRGAPFCIVQLCPNYLDFIQPLDWPTQLPVLTGPLQIPNISPNPPTTMIDHYGVFGSVVLHEMTHTPAGGRNVDQAYEWMNVRSLGAFYGPINADSYMYFAITSGLASDMSLYTHWDGSVDVDYFVGVRIFSILVTSPEILGGWLQTLFSAFELALSDWTIKGLILDLMLLVPTSMNRNTAIKPPLPALFFESNGE
ncbi:hypothetical protein N431DRAFT_451666 [Stipitochalara longipes BDJ]|nr:hypothetical protein N431DRAFT_451666 [Stipitochalara longipes BDJ]